MEAFNNRQLKGMNAYNLRNQPPQKRSKSTSSTMPSNSTPSPKTPKLQNIKGPNAALKQSDTPTARSAHATSSGVDNETFTAAIGELKSLFSNLSLQLNTKLDHALIELSTIKRDLLDTKQKVADLETSASFTADKISHIEKEELPKIQDKLQKATEELEDKLLILEIHNRKQNLLFYGIPHTRDEDVMSTSRDIISRFLNVTSEEAAEIPIVNAHRLPTSRQGNHQQPGQREAAPDPIIIRFGSMTDRDRLLHAYEGELRRPRARGFGQQATPEPADRDPTLRRVSIRTDLPAKLKRERSRLAGVAYQLRREQNLSTRIKVNGAKVLLQTRKKVPAGAPYAPWNTWTE